MAKRSRQTNKAGVDSALEVGKAGLAPSSTFGSSHAWFCGFILVLAVVLANIPAWHAGFIWDDNPLIVVNPCMNGFLGLKEIWTTSAADICPLTLTTFWVQHALWGITPLPYHLVNVLLHGACAVVLWRVLRSLMVPGAWLGAAIWALHPVQVESVMSISETKNTQSGFFFLLSILLFVRWLRLQDLGGRTFGNWTYALTVFFAALAMASKTSTVILPIVLCLATWWMEGRLQWRTLAKTAPIFLLSFAASVLSLWTQKVNLATSTESQWVRTWPERLVAAGEAIWFYLGKLIWPHPLIAVYPRWVIDSRQWFSYLPLLAAIVVLFVLWLRRGSWLRPWFFGYAYFLAALPPALGLFDNYIFRFSLVFDHLQYLASMGPLALLGAGLARLAIPKYPQMQAVFAAALLLFLGLMSWNRAWAYTSEEALWTDTLAKNPNCWAGCNNLGMLAMGRGQVDEAIGWYNKALAISPNLAQARENLGEAFVKQGRTDDAMAQFQAALVINPNLAAAHYSLGNMLVQKGRVDEAMVQFQRALEINPNHAAAHNNLGNTLVEEGKVDEAMVQFETALKIDPNYAEADDNLGNVLVQKGHVEDAIDLYQKALKINPDYAEAHYNLGNALAQTGQRDEAISQFQQVVKIDPNNAAAHTNFGIALLQMGRVEEAILQFQTVVRLNPNDSNAQSNLAKAQAMTR